VVLYLEEQELKSKETLEFNTILKWLADHALSEKAKGRLLSLEPSLNERDCKNRMQETTSASNILEALGSPPLTAMPELDKILEMAAKGSMLLPEQLMAVCSFVIACGQMKRYLKRAETVYACIASYGDVFHSHESLLEEINRSIRNDKVDSGASTALRGTRRKIENTNLAVKSKLESLLKSKKEWLEDGYIATRSGRFVLPVKTKFKSKVEGAVVDLSKTGATSFIEPVAIRRLQEELSVLEIEEDNEVRRILYTLTVLVDSHIDELNINIDHMEQLDFIFAKAKLSKQMKAIPVAITSERKIIIKQGRHPLLDEDICIPLDFEIGAGINGVVITGPNTGGKTVALKTVGLLSLMAQSGLHVPADEGSVFSMNGNVLCDIGDGQSITENLSTFSSHITNIIDILKKVSDESLVLLDELGSGTDPAEGMGIAIAILAELRKRNCLFIATTHYPEVKNFTKNTAGLVNARMEFDLESLKPLFKLQIGEAGESCALYIAQRLGLPNNMLARAELEAYSNTPAINGERSRVFHEEDQEVQKRSARKIKKQIIKPSTPSRSERFDIGDSVIVYPEKEIGIVCIEVNDRGELGVQIKGVKQRINHKRIKLMAHASTLYPEDYDLSIVFDTKENRKARHDMSRKFVPDLLVEYEEDI
jgi:dsDNA-specific endonuclease/ATPase MutS2